MYCLSILLIMNFLVRLYPTSRYIAPTKASNVLPIIVWLIRVAPSCFKKISSSIWEAISLSAFLLTIFDLIWVKKPSSCVGYFLKRYSAVTESRIASPRNSSRSLFVGYRFLFESLEDKDLCVKARLYKYRFTGTKPKILNNSFTKSLSDEMKKLINWRTTINYL